MYKCDMASGYHLIIKYKFGTQFIVGLASQWSTLFMCPLIFISSVSVVVLGGGGAPFCRLSGSQRCGKFGRKETIDCSKAKIALFFRWLIGLSPSPICG